MRGAHLNAVFNLITYLRKLDDMPLWSSKQRDARMHEVASLSERDIAIFVSIMHHRPKKAFEDMNKYLDAKIAYKVPPKPTKMKRIESKPPTSLTQYTSDTLDLYAQKTASNIDAISGIQPSLQSGDFAE
jgi:hypothetical protein